jgi:hypothetical protein
MFDPLEPFRQNQLASIAIRHTRSMNHHDQEQTQCIYNNVAFSSRDLFIDIHTTLFTTFRGFDALTIDDACAGLRFSPWLHANLLH